MRCHYEVLGIEVDANIDEIKKSYKKLALKCHPDKNIGREKEAAEEFKEVCQAFTTLSDPQERAFYDRNKESILRGAGSGDGAQPDVPDIFKYFNSTCFTGFDDDSKGFYAVYRKLFEEIARKDVKHMTEERDIPIFGNSKTDLEDVANFYGYWTSYCTSMPFAWADTIDIRQASCRWVEKKIEKENKKSRDQEKRKFNEEVRNLVYFVRKRDPRWKRRVQEAQERQAAAAEKRKQLQKEQEEQRRELLRRDLEDENLKQMKNEYLEQLKAMERQMRSTGDDMLCDVSSEEEPEEEDIDDYFAEDLVCIICDKEFDTEYALETHNKTKKHRNKAYRFLLENGILEKDHQEEAEVEAVAEVAEENEALAAEENLSEAEEQVPTTSRNKKEKKKRKQEKKKKQRKVLNNSDSETEEPSHCVPDIEEKMANINISEGTSAAQSVSEVTVDEGIEEKSLDETPKVEAQPKAKLKGKKAKEARKKAKEMSQANKSAEENEEIENTCMVCHSEFPSKNKLFQHIKSTGHAALKESNPTNSRKAKNKRK